MEETGPLKPVQYLDFHLLTDPVVRNWKLALGVLLLILVLTLVKSLREQKYYQMNFFVSCSYPLNEDFKLIDGKIKVYNDPVFSQAEMKSLVRNYQLLVNKSEPSLKSITFIPSRTARENNSYEVALQVYDASRIDLLVSGFVEYLNKNQSFANKLSRERKHYEILLEEINQQINSLPAQAQGINPDLALQKTRIEWLEKRESVLSKLDKAKGFEVSVAPVTPGHYANMTLTKKMLLALVWGSIVSAVIAFMVGVTFHGKK